MLAALQEMSTEREANAREAFSLASFCLAHPALCGMFLPEAGKNASTLGLIHIVQVEDDGDEIYSIHYERTEKSFDRVAVSVATPPRAQRTLIELLTAVHFAALARDNIACPPREIRHDEQLVDAWGMEQDGLAGAERVLAALLADAYLCVAQDKSDSNVSSAAAAGTLEFWARVDLPPRQMMEVEQLAERLTEALTKPFSPPSAALVERMTTRIAHITQCSRSLMLPAAATVAPIILRLQQNSRARQHMEGGRLPSHPSCSLEPLPQLWEWSSYLAAAELLRWRLLRGAIDGRLDGACGEAAAVVLRRIAKQCGWASASSSSSSSSAQDGSVVRVLGFADMTAAAQSLFVNEAHCNDVLSSLRRASTEASAAAPYVADDVLIAALVHAELVAYELERVKSGAR